MGQTQILFIVLSVIIVGIAVAVGITQFGSNATQANRNAVLLDLNDIAMKAQTWYRTPTSMGGGGGTFSGITFASIGLTDSSGTYHNANANISGAGYVISSATATEVHVNAKGNEHIQYDCVITTDGVTPGAASTWH